MPHAQRSDAELVTAAVAGDGAAFRMLYRRHVDTVHDHLVRWSRDPRVAADATLSAFTALLREVDELRDPRGVLGWLLRTARNHAVVEQRRTGEATTAPPELPAALLAVSPVRAGSAERVAEATQAGPALMALVGDLDGRTLSVLDLTARAGLSVGDLGSVLGVSQEEAQLLVQRMRSRVEDATPGTEAPLRAYAALADVRAPATLRAALESTIDEHWAPAHTHHRWWVPVALCAVLLLVVLGSVRALTGNGSGTPPVAIAEAVDPTDVALVGDGASEDALPDDDASEPTEAPDEPSDTPSEPLEPVPTEQPRPDPVALVVSVESPVSQSVFTAGPPVAGSRSTVAVPLRASVTGTDPSSDALEIEWRSSVEPDTVLLAGLTGDAALWLTAPCQDTVHQLTVTATDPDTGTTASDTVSVLVSQSCPPPPTVQIDTPGDGTTVTATGVGLERRRTAEVPVAARSDTDDGSFGYRWSSDRAPGTVLLDGASGSVTLWSDTCEPLTHVLSVEVTDPATGRTGTASVRVTVDPACTVE